jgi:hypothetical protein
MKKQDHNEKFIDLINGKLSPGKEEEVKAALIESGISVEEVESLKSFYQHLDDSNVPESSDRMDKRFYALLKEEENKILLGTPDINSRSFLSLVLSGPVFRVAAGIALFILGWFAATWSGNHSTGRNRQITELSGEVKQLKETLVLSMIQQSSSVERIKAVNMVSDLEKPDDRIIGILLNVLDHDTNDNVRLIAMDALINYSYIPEVRSGLVSSLSLQTSPLIQMRLTELMMALREKDAVPELRKMLENENLNYNVRGKINSAMSVLL